MTSISTPQPPSPLHHRLYPSFGRTYLYLCLGMAVSFAVFGFKAPYYTKAASDMVSAYEGLLFNSGLAPDFLVYPGLIDRAALGLWYQLLHAIGWLAPWRLQDLPAGGDLKTYEAAWQSLVEAARVYSLLTGLLCAGAFMWLVRRWLGDTRIAILAGVAWAFSSGNALGFRILRPEMLTAALVSCALLLVLIAARDGRSWWRFGALMLAGLLVSLAIIDKVQAIIPALTIVPLALVFGPQPPRVAGARPGGFNPMMWFTALAMSVAAVIAAKYAIALMQVGVAQMPAEAGFAYKPLSGGLSGRYQFVIAGAIAASMGLYSWVWRLSLAEAVRGIAAVAFGLAVGFDLMYLNTSTSALTAVANPLEHLQANSAGDGEGLLSQGAGVVGPTILKAIGKALAIHTFIKPTHRPTLLIEWLALAGAYLSWRRGDRLHALQIGLLIGSAIGQDALFSLRDVKSYYLPYSDAPIILAGALALTTYADKIKLPRFERLTVGALVVYIIWGHATLARAVVYGQHDRGKVCGIVTQFTKRITIPYCADPSLLGLPK